jgi:uncharacterized protein YraI
MRLNGLIGVVGTLLIGVATAAHAQNAFTARSLNIHAGPDRQYPLVARLDEGTPVEVNGCLDDWSWCDVSFGDNRGWAYAPGLSYVYEGDRVPLYSYAPGLGISVVTFSLGTYWDQYYRGRPWYGQRTVWMNRHFAHQRPPGPAPQAHPPLHAHNGRPGAGQPQTAQRAPAEARERGTAERGPADRAPGTGNIRSADSRGERPPANEKGNTGNGHPDEQAAQHARPAEHPSDQRKSPDERKDQPPG